MSHRCPVQTLWIFPVWVVLIAACSGAPASEPHMQPKANAATGGPHTDLVQAVDVSDDGRRVASAGVDGTVRLWNPESRHLIATMQHDCTNARGETSVYSVSVSPGGTRVAVACPDHVQVWQVSDRDMKLRIPILDKDEVESRYSVEFGPEGELLATAGWETGQGRVRVWKVDSGELQAGVPGYGPVAFDPSGQILAVNLERPPQECKECKKTIVLGQRITQKQQNRLGLYQVQSGTLLRTFDEERRADDDVVFDSTGDFVAATNGTMVTVWRAVSGEEVLSVDLELAGSSPWRDAEPVHAVAFGPEDEYLVVATQSGSAARVSLEDGKTDYLVRRAMDWGSDEEVARPVDYPELFYFREQMFALGPQARLLVTSVGGATVFLGEVGNPMRPLK